MNRSDVFLIFKVIMMGLLLFIQFYCHRRLSRYLKSSNKSRALLIGTTIPFIIFTIPLCVFFFWIPRTITVSPWLTYVCIYPFYLWHFSLLVVCLVLAIFQLLRMPIRLIGWSVRKIRSIPAQPAGAAMSPSTALDHRRRKFIRQSLTVLTGAAFTGSAYGAFRKDKYEMTELSIPFINLPSGFEDFSITLISDIHSSIFMSKEKMQEYARIVNALRSDLITVTGDFVNSQLDEVYPFAEAFEGLKAPFGVYGVLGNHDYYTRHVDAVAKSVEECGIKLLVNEHVALSKNGQQIYLLGSDDIGTDERADLAFDKSMSGIAKDAFKVLMCHRPYYFENASLRNVNIMLSGHTHGGQIVFGKINDNYIAPARIASPYIAGLYSLGASKLYVSRGIGTVGVPIRINCPPEITKIILTRG